MDVESPIPWFSCKEGSSNHHLKNFWNSDTILEKESAVQFSPSQILFGKSISMHSLWKDSTFLFMEIKKQCHFIQVFPDYSNDSKLSDLEKSRKDVCESFSFILNNLKAMKSSLKEKKLANAYSISEVLSGLMKELMKLLFFLGPVGSLCNIPLTDLLEARSSGFYHCIHLYLDVWCNVLAVFRVNSGFPVRIDNMKMASDVGFGNPVTEIAVVLMTDLISIALKTFKSMGELLVSSPFFCTCVRDVWTVLINILDNRSSTVNDSFWSNYFIAVQKIHASMDQDAEQEENIFAICSLAEISQENFIEGVLWITSYIAPLYNYDSCGNVSNGRSPKSCYQVLKFLIKLLLVNERKEKYLSRGLFYSLHLSSLWEADPKFLNPVIDFFVKKVDENFSLAGSGLGGMCCLHKNAASWYQSIDILSMSCRTWEGETSFGLFLRLLFVELSKGSQVWRVIKGNIYCKFSAKRMKEFTEIGLQNIFSIFLMIVKSGQVEACDKICEFASAIEDTANPKKQAVTWKSLFALIYLHKKTPINLEKVVIQLTKYFDSACSQYSHSNRDSMHKANIMNLLRVYIDNINDIFEQSGHSSVLIPQLIAPGFSVLLNTCCIMEMNDILRTFVSILSKVQNLVTGRVDAESGISELQIVEVLEQFLNYIYPFLKNLSTSNTPPIFIADIAAALTSLTFRCTASNTQVDFSSIFASFSRDSINSSILCRYLCFLLDDELVIASLGDHTPNIHCFMFQCWVKCTIFLEPPNDQMRTLTQKVLLLDDIIGVFPEIKNLDFSSTNHVKVTIAIFRTIRHTYETIDLQRKHQVKLKMSQYFKTFAACVVSRVSKQCDSKTLNHVYEIASHLVEYCAPLLYMKFDAATILSNLLDKTFIPHLLFPKDQKSQALLTSSIRIYLPNILRGLFCLDYRKDNCIDRQIKEAIKNFAFGYSFVDNPFTKLLVNTANSRPEGLNPETFEFLLETIRRLVIVQKEPPRIIFYMLFEVLQSSPFSKKQIAGDILLKCIFEDKMKQENAFLKSLIRKIFTYFGSNIGLDASKPIITPIIEWFIKEKLQWRYAQVFDVLYILIDHLPQLFSNVLGTLTKAIEDIEKKRGCGRDSNLRNRLDQIIAKFSRKVNNVKTNNHIKTEV